MGESAAVDASVDRVRERLLGLYHSYSEADLDQLFESCDEFHAAAFAATPELEIRCTKGCANCCSQAVFDLHAFEVERIGQRLREQGRASAIVAALERRIEAYDQVRLQNPRRPRELVDDWVERVALAFWSLDLPCVLLDEQGACSVHDLRPWSCRRSFAASDPELCRGATADDSRRRFFLLEPFEDFDDALATFDEEVPFEAETSRLDLSLLRWLKARRA